MIDPNVLQNLKDRLDLQKSQYPFATPLFEILSKVVSMVQEVKARVDRVEKMEGPKGEKGDQGPIGPQGERGLDGADGKPGKDGNDGKQGKTGLTGPAGERGDRGLQGIQGVKGDRGDNGEKGDKGDNGSPDTAEQVRDKLSSLKGGERLDAKHIKNLPEVIREVRPILSINRQGSSTTTTQSSSIEFIIDGGGSAITTGIKGDLEIPFACTITQATLLADQTGSVVIDVWKDSYTNFAPTVADTITASAKPTLSSALKYQDSTLTGWTKTISAGDILRFNVDSASTVQRVTLSLKVTK